MDDHPPEATDRQRKGLAIRPEPIRNPSRPALSGPSGRFPGGSQALPPVRAAASAGPGRRSERLRRVGPSSLSRLRSAVGNRGDRLGGKTADGASRRCRNGGRCNRPNDGRYSGKTKRPQVLLAERLAQPVAWSRRLTPMRLVPSQWGRYEPPRDAKRRTVLRKPRRNQSPRRP